LRCIAGADRMALRVLDRSLFGWFHRRTVDPAGD
jgi:hypothetical protein